MEMHIMRTTLNIPDGLLSDLDKVAKGKPKTRAICEAIEYFIKQKRREMLLGLRGKLDVLDVSDELEAAELKDAERVGRKRRNS